MDVTGVVLAGGRNSRMGRPKALLKVDGLTIIERVLDAVKQVAREVLVVSNEEHIYSSLGYPVIGDLYPGKGPLGGIYTGLCQANQHWILVAACDMPFLSGNVANALLDRRSGFDLVVPRVGGFPEPLFAVYSKDCLGPMEHQLMAGRYKISAVFEELQVCYVDETELGNPLAIRKLFFNVNTPEDLVVACNFNNVKDLG